MLPSIALSDSEYQNQTQADTPVYQIESAWPDQYGETFNTTQRSKLADLSRLNRRRINAVGFI
jgi:hypothetical protein